jgi:S1-C subfamily serine protease
VLGAFAGAALVWVLGAAALEIPGQPQLRKSIHQSEILRRLNEVVPPSRLLDAVSRIDPFPSLVGPVARVPAPSPEILALPGVRVARGSVVRVVGSACGFGVTGSGWVAGPRLVVTAAHVVAGERRTTVQRLGGLLLPARVVAFDARNDLAVLRVPRLRARPLATAPARAGAPVAILGYPENGPLDAEPGRVGSTEQVRSVDAYGRGPLLRTMTSVRGLVRHGNSGGPAVDAHGAVLVTIFGATTGGDRVGLGVPREVVRTVLARARGAAVSTGRCVT